MAVEELKKWPHNCAAIYYLPRPCQVSYLPHSCAHARGDLPDFRRPKRTWTRHEGNSEILWSNYRRETEPPREKSSRATRDDRDSDFPPTLGTATRSQHVDRGTTLRSNDNAGIPAQIQQEVSHDCERNFRRGTAHRTEVQYYCTISTTPHPKFMADYRLVGWTHRIVYEQKPE